MHIVVVGGGAAGFFAAIQSKVCWPDSVVTIVEKSNEVLSKVRISGGGRCNVTHACFDPKQLAENYPRGGKALIGPFHRFQPQDTFRWFESRGVPLKIESDNRVFPVSDSSESIINCLLNEATRLNVRLWLSCGVFAIQKNTEGTFDITLENGQQHKADRVIMATGSSRAGHALCESLGHQIIAPIPSLFTIKIDDPGLLALSGLSVPQVTLQVKAQHTYTQTGPLLITHWGLSGPAMIKLSAWAARPFFEAAYRLALKIDWLPQRSLDAVMSQLKQYQTTSKKMGINEGPFQEIPHRLWVYWLQKLNLAEKRWAQLGKKELEKLLICLKHDQFITTGKGAFKEEFVTCGGVALPEVQFKTMQSRVCSGLYFAGEILDVDGITGGFNFQNAWTTGFLAGSYVGQEFE